MFVNEAHKFISKVFHHLENPKMYPSIVPVIQYVDSKFSVLISNATSKYKSYPNANNMHSDVYFCPYCNNNLKQTPQPNHMQYFIKRWETNQMQFKVYKNSWWANHYYVWKDLKSLKKFKKPQFHLPMTLKICIVILHIVICNHLCSFDHLNGTNLF